MGSEEFIRKCKGIVAEYLNENMDATEHQNITGTEQSGSKATICRETG